MWAGSPHYPKAAQLDHRGEPNPLPAIRYARIGSAAAPAPDGIPQTPFPLLIVAMALIILPVMALCLAIAYWRADVVDDQLFALFGWRIAHGATVYVDVWDNKPPGIYWLNALGFLLAGGENYLGVIALCGAALVVSFACFFIISASVYFRGAAAIATVLASFYITHGYFQGGTNRTETFLVMFELAAVAAYVRGCWRDRWWVWLLAGLLCGFAFLFKQVGLAAWGAMGVHTLVLAACGDIRWPTAIKRCVLLAIGPVLVVAAAVGVLWRQDALDAAWFAVVEFNRGYFEAGRSSLTDTFLNRYMLQNEIFRILPLPLLMCAAALIHATLWWLRPRLRPAEIEQPLVAFQPACPRYLVLFVVWWAAAFYGAVVSPHYFRHYLVPTIPPMMLIAGYLINVLRTEISLTARMQQRIGVTAAFVAIGYFAWSALYRQWEELSKVYVYRFVQQEPPDWELVGEVLERYTTPEETVQAFGYMPGIYLQAHRMNATRFATTEKIGQIGRTRQAGLIREHLIGRIDAEPPAAIVISAQEFFEINNPDQTTRTLDPLDTWLAGLLAKRYRLVADVPKVNVFIFKRSDLVPKHWKLPEAPLAQASPPAATKPAATAPAATRPAPREK